MAIVSNYPLNVNWAQETSNKISFNETEFGVGVTYKGPIVSNQLNGISFILSQILQYNQATDGYYSPTMRYHKGNFVKIVHTGLDHMQQMESYICINDNNGAGIVNTPPITGAVSISTNGIVLYSGGEVNNTYWKRIDVGGSAVITPEVVEYPTKLVETDKFDYMCRFMTIPDLPISADSGLYKTIKTNAVISTKANRTRCFVELRIEGKYTKSLDGTKYNKPIDYFNMPVPDVYIDNIYFRRDVDAEEDNHSVFFVPYEEQNSLYTSTNMSEKDFLRQVVAGTLTPYGFNVVIGYTTDALGKRSWGIYLGFQYAGIEEITLNGESTIPVSISTQVSTANFTIMNVIPVRPKGGKNSYDRYFELIEYDQTIGKPPGSMDVNSMFWYSRGLLPLSGFIDAKEYTLTYDNLGVGILWMLARMQSRIYPTLVNHSGAQLRNLVDDYAGYRIGQLLEPGLPNITGWFMAKSMHWAGMFPSVEWLYYPQATPKEGEALQNAPQLNSKSCVIEDWGFQPTWANFWDAQATSMTGTLAQILDASASNPIYKGKKYRRTLTLNKPATQEAVVEGFTGNNYNDVTTKSVTIRRYMKAY